jgi:hypothetical protein
MKMTHTEKQIFRRKLQKEGFSYEQVELKLKEELNKSMENNEEKIEEVESNSETPIEETQEVVEPSVIEEKIEESI